MDESLSEFQEKRKNNTGPKNLKKKRINTKLPKRARGQKDIRSLIGKKDNNIVSYSKDFDKVCKKTGVDIDSEQLQLAIALSKSLHDADSIVDREPQSLEPLTSQERILKIKNTLQGYGFQIGKKQISTDTIKRKRYKKRYKLLLSSQIEKEQNISDKYAEVLAGNIFKSPVNLVQCRNCDKGLYYNTTHIPYEYLKNNDVFYVKDLFVRSCNKICLLKDWSDIPGRPLSPTLKVCNINFDDMIFTQEELDCILSGTIYTTQLIITNKSMVLHSNDNIKAKTENCESEFTQNNLNIKSPAEDNLLIDRQCNSKTMSNSHFRCISPDIFDDEVSVVLEGTNNVKQPLEQTVLRGDFNRTYCMDLTQCVNVFDNACTFGKGPDSYRPVDIKETRTSSDFMELTKCVNSNSDQDIVKKIDLTQPRNYSNLETDNFVSQNKNTDIVDLTQIGNHDLTEAQKNREHKATNAVIVLDDELNFSQQYNEDCHNQHICSDIVSKNSHCLCEISFVGSTEEKKLFNSCKGDETIILDEENQENDSSMHVGRNLLKPPKRLSDYINEPFYGMSCEYKKQVENVCDSNEVATVFDEKQSEEIDLTQSSNSISSEGDNECIKLCNQHSEDVTSLGKKENISIDYDEIFDDIVKQSKSQNSISLGHNDDSNKSNVSNHLNTSLQTSKFSDVLDISDEEVNSLCKTKHDISKNGQYDSEKNPILKDSFNIDTKNRLVNEYILTTNNKQQYSITPNREIEQSEKLNFEMDFSTPSKESRVNIKSTLNTPKNCEYIVKTSEVTPMLDYETMASPERNKELEKYGLKPLKRKRAIQILTHIYTQTHPLVESYVEVSSPSKRQKRDNDIVKNSPHKITSPKSVDCILEVDKENLLYAVTKEEPDIKNIDCAPEDWVFQKREKAKIHSCRVPLHVAFHNYVSCRQRLREAILRYEPVNFDFIHKDLAVTGYRYNPKDLLRFMDKKCITVRTADNNQRNRKS